MFDFNELLEEKKNERHDLPYNRFQDAYGRKVASFRKDIVGNEQDVKQFDFIDYEKPISICPEPYTFISSLLKKETFEERELFLRDFIELNGKKIYINESVEFIDRFWNNQTKNGINLRPGLEGDRNFTSALRFDNERVHGLIAGITGSGKSVLLNTIIMNLLFEYPAWELDLFLIDFKKVEFSRYSIAEAPTINAVCATEEVSYVVSVIKYIYDLMNARELLFSKLNQTNIKEFREKYDVVLPRVVLIIDEFQQMFLDATAKESTLINSYLTAITKKGRATGIHLLFASQEMSGTLPQNVKMNFKIRMVLPCTREVSVEVLGNKGGESLERFHALANIDSGDEDTNIKFSVPYIDTALEKEDGKTQFMRLISKVREMNNFFSFEKNHKFYEETSTHEIFKMIELKKHPRINKEIDKIINESQQYFENLILGPAVTYTSRKVDYESIFIENSKNNHVACHSPRLNDCAYLLNLLFVNFYLSSRTYQHYIINRNTGIYDQYPINQKFEELQKSFPSEDKCSIVYTKDQDIIDQISDYERRLVIYSALANSENLMSYFDYLIEAIGATQFLKNKPDRKFLEIIKKQLKEKNESMIDERFKEMPYWKLFTSFKNGEVTLQTLFQPRIYWMIGIDNMDIFLKQLERIPFLDANNVNVFFVFIASNIEDIRIRDFLKKKCHYVFLSHAPANTYDRFNGHFSKRNEESIVIDLLITHLSAQLSFKKFKADLIDLQIKSLNFDYLLMEGAD